MKKVVFIMTFFLLASCVTASAARFVIDTEVCTLVALKYGVDKEECKEIIESYFSDVKAKRRKADDLPVERYEMLIIKLANKYNLDTKTVASIMYDYELLTRR